MKRVHKINSILTRHYINTLKVIESPCPDVEDDYINVTDTISVQVGRDYLCITKVISDDCISFKNTNERLLVADLLAVIRTKE